MPGHAPHPQRAPQRARRAARHQPDRLRPATPTSTRQVLATDADIGYLIMDLDQDVSHEVREADRRARDQHPHAHPVLAAGSAIIKPTASSVLCLVPAQKRRRADTVDDHAEHDQRDRQVRHFVTFGGSDEPFSVADGDRLGAGAGRSAQAVQRVARVVALAVEEVLGVVDHALVRPRAGRRATRRSWPGSLAGHAHDLLQVQASGLAHDRADRREGLGEDPAGPSSSAAALRAGASCRRRRRSACSKRSGRAARRRAPSGSTTGSRPR